MAVAAASIPAASEQQQHMDVEAEPQFQPIERIQEHGVNVADINKLRDAGIHTVGSLLQVPVRALLQIKGISEAKVDKVVEAARKLTAARSGRFCTATEVLQRRAGVVRITSGSRELDGILGGGFESGALTELHGEFRTGKSQICMTLCVTAQLPPELGGGNGRVAYVDTEGTFRPERIAEIAPRFGLDGAAVNENIFVARVYTHEQQMELVPGIAALLADPDQGPFRLLVVDSVIALFRVDFAGRGELSERQQKLGRHLSQLKKIAEEFNVCVVLVNQVCADPGASAMFVSDPKKPVGGHILAHACTTRVQLRKGKGEQRIARIFDSPSMPEADATFSITPEGIQDAS